MANRKMTLSKTKLSQLVSSGISGKAKSIGLAAALLLSSTDASALGLGSLEIESNLDQPLSGTIQLRIAPGDDVNSLTAVIASRDDFESLGIEYPEYLKDFSLLLDTLGDERVLRVTSNNVVIKEPFIHFLVRVQWSGGSFLREYTALIDPPVYAAESPSSLAQPREVGTDQTYQSDTLDTPDVEPEIFDEVVVEDIPEDTAEEVDTAADEPLIDDNFYNDDAETSSEESDVEFLSDTQPTDASYGPVESGESLSVIAQDLQRQFPDLSIYQIMKVLFDENKSSFIGENINGLIQGAILRIGDLNAIRDVDVAESRAFYNQQILDWNPQLLEPAGTDSINVGQDNYNFQDDSSFTADAGDSDTFGTEDSFQVGASTESDNYVSSDQGDSREGEVLALREEVASLQSSLASSELEKQELTERISLLEGQLADMNRLAELSVESADLASIEDTLAEQNNASEESANDGFDAIEEFTDVETEGGSALDEFLSSGDDSIDEVASDLSEDANTAIDELAADGEASLDEFLADSDATDASLDDSLAEGETELESVIEEASEDAGLVTTTPATTTVSTPSSEKSLIEKAKSLFFEGGLWKVLAGLGVLLAAGVGLLFMRRRRADEEFEISMLSIESNSHSVGNSATTQDSASMSMSHTASVASEAGVNADKETSFLTVYSDSDAVVQADEVDPVAEADVYIAYGRDEQAEEVLLDGVVSHPDRIDIKQKLLSLYHKRQNAEGFERIAEELYSQRAALTGDIWAQVCEMGKEVAPSNPLFELSGDDLNTAVEADSELLLEGGDISEVSIDVVPTDDDIVPTDEASVDVDAATVPMDNELGAGDDLIDHLDDESHAEKRSELEESLTIEDESEMVVGSLADDESIQLVNFDDGRSEISELNEVEIDALEFGGDIPDSMDLSKADDNAVSAPNVDDDDLLDFEIEAAALSDDKSDDKQEAEQEHSVGEVQEVSDLEIDPDYDEARTQYELAKVFVDLGDEDGARKILVELAGNDDNADDVQNDAKALLESINS